MNLKPTFNNIIIKPHNEFSSKKLILPDAIQKQSNKGEIIAVGPGRRHIDGKLYPPSFEVGQEVLFNKLQSYPLEFEGEKYVMVPDEAIGIIFENTKQAPEKN